MKVWIPIAILSLILTLAMAFVFVIFALIALNGFMSMQAAMPTYLVFNCLVWPFMVGITTAVAWVILALVKRQKPLWQLALLNAAIVTICLGLIAALLYYT